MYDRNITINSSSLEGVFAVVEKRDGYRPEVHYVLKDNLGSWTTITYAWGNLRNPLTWTGSPARLPKYDRGFTGHEHLYHFGLINMNGRVYDPFMSTFLSPDNYIQAPDNSQNFNRYAYCLNNPLKYTDPSGEIFWAPIILGATIGAYMGGTIANNDYNPLQWNYDSGKTWGYMLGGAIVGGISGYIGGAIAASEIPMANTLGIMASSYTYSLGTNLYTNGQTDTSISFGFASYNFTSDEFGYLGKKGNSTLENIGYGLGALANISDILAGMKPGNVTLRTENNPNYSSKGDYIGHSQITMGNNVIIDWGPTEYKTSLLGLIEGTNSYENGRLIENMKGISFWNPIDVHGVNIKRILKFSDYLNKGGHYNLLYNNCVSMTSRALNISGVFNIGIHPYILHTQMYLRSLGLRPALFSYFILNIKQP